MATTVLHADDLPAMNTLKNKALFPAATTAQKDTAHEPNL
jgi:hypothetical protein